MSGDAPLRVLRVLRVLQLLAPARAGGLESVVLQLSAGLRDRGHDVRVAAVLEPGSERDHPFVAAVREAGVPVDVLALGGRDYRGERRAVAALLERHGSQVLHTHGYRPDVVDGAVARRMGRAHVTTLHGFIGGTWRGRVYEWLQVRAARRADAAIAVSTVIERRLATVAGPGRIVLLRNAVAPPHDALPRAGARAALGLPTDGFMVGWVGRVSQEKGPDLFVEAIAAANARDRGDAVKDRGVGGVHGVLVGDGPMLPAVRALAAARGMAERMTFTGMVANASRYLAAFDMLALTSHTEGTPMVLLEAMWAGVPIVATAVGGVPDVVGPEAALLCPAGDAAAIGRALAELSHDPTDGGRRESLRRAARTRVATEFDPGAWLGAHEATYRRALSALTGTRYPIEYC